MDPTELGKDGIYHKLREEHKLVELLMAFRDDFENLRSSMLHRYFRRSTCNLSTDLPPYNGKIPATSLVDIDHSSLSPRCNPPRSCRPPA
ncbi:hypothetical protein Ddye_032741 [Dipteronia dyeriana]|uniref:Uncharacterized protein n=1 Tax=Dipteronia dyeriana TaxID=168575 RepID=A0AAD9TCZ7_9ROSI|nr:hypothetical protein Ddye_032741 [Dipteronia dyeriana]